MMLKQSFSFEYPRSLHFQCTECALCCGDTRSRTRSILLLKREADQISRITSQPVEGFATKIENREPYVYMMRKTAADGKCFFLEENRCTIYEKRPLICRFYPFELTASKDGKYCFLPTEECPGIGIGGRLKKEYFEKLFKEAYNSLIQDVTTKSSQ